MSDDFDISGILGNKTVIKGELFSEHTLRFDGRLEGKLISADMLIVGKEGLVKGTLISRKASLAGRIEGDVYIIEKAELHSGCVILGNFFAKSAKIFEGSEIEGKCMIGTFSAGKLAEIEKSILSRS